MTKPRERAESMPYFNTGTSAPDTWIAKARRELEKAGGEVLSEGFGREGDKSSFILRFRLQGQSFRVVWPVLESKRSFRGSHKQEPFLKAAKRQAATMLYHDVKAACVKSRVVGARVAFFAHMELPDGRVASQLSGAEVVDFPKLLPAGVIEGEIVDP